MFDKYSQEVQVTQNHTEDNSVHQTFDVQVDATSPINIDINPELKLLRFEVESVMGKGILESALDPYCQEPHLTILAHTKTKTEKDMSLWNTQITRYQTDIFLNIPISIEKMTYCGKYAIIQYKPDIHRVIPVERYVRLKDYQDEIDHVISEGTNHFYNDVEKSAIIQKLREISGLSEETFPLHELRGRVESFYHRERILS